MTSIWVLGILSASWNMFFQHICAKKLKKGIKSYNLFYVGPPIVRIEFSPLGTIDVSNVLITQWRLLVNINSFLLNFAANFFPFLLFLAFLQKNAEKPYFNQRLEWAAPNCWSKYTTKGVYEWTTSKFDDLQAFGI